MVSAVSFLPIGLSRSLENIPEGLGETYTAEAGFETSWELRRIEGEPRAPRLTACKLHPNFSLDEVFSWTGSV